MTHRTT